jgi:HD-like signal output (HDOD) protein
MHHDKLNKLIEKIESLPTLPIVYQKVVELCETDNVSIQDLVKVIEMDQPLTLKIMKVANSSFYSTLSEVSSLEHALIKLGLNEIKSIALGLSVYNYFTDIDDNAFDRQLFWKHAIICSQTAKFLSTHFKLPSDDTLFLSGLIHDMGKLVLDVYFHEEFVRIIELVATGRQPFSKAEKAVLGTTHYQVAAKLLKQWRFPQKVTMQVLFHHAPWYSRNNEINSIVIYLANILTKMAGYACHPGEKKIVAEEFADSTECGYINKNGFDLDLAALRIMVGRINEFVHAEHNNVLRLFS